MLNIDTHLTSCSPAYDVYTYNFNKNEIETIKDALMRYDLVKEIRELLKMTQNDPK